LKRILAISLLVLLIISGCSSMRSQDAATSEPGYNYADEETGNTTDSDSLQKIIKSGNISMEVDDLEETVTEIKSFISQYEGQIISIEQYSSQDNKQAYISLKVPSNNYDKMHDSLISLGSITSDTTSTDDVTEEFIDLNARLDMLKDSKEAYTRLLEKAETVEEILQVERELERIVYEIESTQGRIDYINNQVNMSRFRISIKEKTATEFEGINFFERVKFALKDGFNSMLNFLVNLVIFLIWILPFVPFILILYFVIKKFTKFIKGRRKNKEVK